MKPAFVLIPEGTGTVNRAKYLDRCIRHVLNKDLIILNIYKTQQKLF